MYRRKIEQFICSEFEPVVQTKAGKLRGYQINGIYTFRGIRYAKAKRLHMPMEKVFVNLHKYGNTSAASVAIALDEANREGRFKRGDNVAFAGFGAGLTWASLVLKWY